MNTVWSIWIDIENFSRLWSESDLGLSGINALTEGICKIGSRHFIEQDNRVFAHQFGDGFLIHSDFAEPCLDRCAAMAIALLRYVSNSGCLARAAIAEGQFADVQGLRPKFIRDSADVVDNNSVYLGYGLMTLIPVMGTALINANKLDQANPKKGSILTISTSNLGRLSSGHRTLPVPNKPELSVIDWLHSESDELRSLMLTFNSEFPAREEAELNLRNYIKNQNPPEDWTESTSYFNNLQG